MGLLLSGKNPAAYKTAERSMFTATAGQTTFTVPVGYNVGDIDVFLNGLKLVEGDDFFATNGTTVVLASGANLGDSLSVVCYYNFLNSSSYTKSESDNRYIQPNGQTSMSSYLRTPNYGVSSTGDNLATELTAAPVGQQGVGVKAYGRSMSTFGGDLHHIADTRGVGGSQRFYAWNGTSLSIYMNIDSVGRLTVPNQPAFYAYQGPGGTTSAGPQIFTSTRLNVGNYYNTSNGRFTAPVTGNYAFQLHLLHRGNNTSSNVEITFYKNGFNLNTRGMAYSVNSSSGGHTPMHTSVIIPLNAGDYVQGGASAIGSGSDIYLADNLGHFSGYLIG
jgi:hypothetical protein